MPVIASIIGHCPGARKFVVGTRLTSTLVILLTEPTCSR
jgi:hypothetical protein